MTPQIRHDTDNASSPHRPKRHQAAEVPSTRQRIPASDRPRVLAMVKELYVQQGKPIRKIAAELDRSYGLVHRMLKDELGVQMRPRGGQHPIHRRSAADRATE